mmetsp:Transcript_17600/g.23046  ORF Transcript_17600/g.23046 Transcript_17600/m.23046 type:complete len:151 (-) Transcript_17600:1929-2381(-)
MYRQRSALASIRTCLSQHEIRGLRSKSSKRYFTDVSREKIKVACIHAMQLSIRPTETAFINHFPEATVVNILDDSLSTDVSITGLDESMHDRFSKLGEYAASISVDGVLFTCSAFGSCIEKVQEELTVPVLKPNQALQEQIISSAKQGYE